MKKASGTGARTSAVITFASTYAVVFKATTNLYQAVPFNSSNYGGTGYTTYNAATITMTHPSSDDNDYSVLGDVELNAEPTWAAANMEGVVAVDVFVPEATATVAGIVGTGAQTIAGDKTLTGFTSLGGDVALKCKKLTGTSGAAEGAAINIAHGLTGTKIVGFNCILSHNTGYGLPPNHIQDPEYQYYCYFDGTNFVVTNSATNSGNILSKPITILAWYIA